MLDYEDESIFKSAPNFSADLHLCGSCEINCAAESYINAEFDPINPSIWALFKLTLMTDREVLLLSSESIYSFILPFFSFPPLSQHSWLHFWKAHHNLLVPHVCCWSSQLLLGPLFWKRLSNIYKNCNEHHLPTASYSLNLCSKGVGRGERGWGRSTFLANQYPEADVWNEPTKPLLVCHKSNALWDFVVLT